MTSTDAPTLSDSSIPKNFPETVKTFDDVMKALGVTNLDVDHGTQAMAISGTNKLIARHNKLWVWENRVRLKEELELLNEM